MTSTATNGSAEGDYEHPIRITTDEAVVEKTSLVHSDEAVKIVFRITNREEAPVEFRMRDPLPDEIDPEAIGFHREYDRRDWHVAETGHVVYEGVIDPGEEKETLYGSLVTSLDQRELFLDPPSVETRRVEPEDSTTWENGGESSGGSEDSESADDSDGGVEDGLGGRPADAAPVSSVGTALDDGEFSGAPMEHDAGVADGGSESVEGETSLIETLVDELEDRELAEEERSLLRSRLGLDSSNSVDVRLRHVQNQVDDIVAYRDALEGFIDENGETSDILEEFREDVTAIDRTVDAVEDRLATFDDEVSELRRRVDEFADVEQELQSLADDVDELRSDLGSLDRRHEADVERLDEQVDDVETSVGEEVESIVTDLEALRDDVERGKQWREQLSGAARLVPENGENRVAGD